MSGPTIDRASSSGDIWTPWEFIYATQSTFGCVFRVDLAASGPESAKAPTWITPEQDSLRWDWVQLYDEHRHDRGALWLNPPYSNITPWVKKCAELCEYNKQVELMLLVPASVGANWFWDYVWPYATVYSVGRMVFDNCFDRKTGKSVRTVYPKDLILCHYTNTSPSRTLQRWQWQKTETKARATSGGR